VSPTYEASQRFLRELARLSDDQHDAFLSAKDELIAGLRERPPRFAPRLRIKRVKGSDDVWELTWAADGRATFRYGAQVITGEAHVLLAANRLAQHPRRPRRLRPFP
jgi:hypothetical protein